MNAIAERTSFSTAPQSVWLEVHPALGISMMDHLFNRLDGAYPTRWRAAFPSQQAIDNWRESWAESFNEERLTPDDIKAGLKACRKRYDWPPSISEFIKACRPEINVDAALYEAAQQIRLRSEGKDKWSDPAIYWAAVKVGEFDMLNQPHSALLKRFSAALAEVLGQDQIPSVPARLVALPDIGKATASPERVEAEMRKVRATQKQVGNKDWAHRIIERAKKDKTVPMAVLNMARAALGVTPC